MRDDRRQMALTDSEAVLRQVLLELDDLGAERRAEPVEDATGIPSIRLVTTRIVE